jgi:hypothetical protein
MTYISEELIHIKVEPWENLVESTLPIIFFFLFVQKSFSVLFLISQLLPRGATHIILFFIRENGYFCIMITFCLNLH